MKLSTTLSSTLFAYEQTVSDPCRDLQKRAAGGGSRVVPFPSAPMTTTTTQKQMPTVAVPHLDSFTKQYADGVMDAIHLKTPQKNNNTAGYKFGYQMMRDMQKGKDNTNNKTAGKHGTATTTTDNPHMTRPDTAREDMKRLIPYLQKEHQPIWRHLMQKDTVLEQLSRTVLVSFTLLTATSVGDEAIATYAPLCRLLRKMDTLEKCLTVRDVGKRPLLTPPSVSGPTSEQSKTVLNSVVKCRVHRKEKQTHKDPLPPPAPKAVSKTVVCKVLREKQANSIVHLRVHSLFTLLPGRWIDSACLDAYLHVLHRHFPKRDQLFVISAEHDPHFNELIQSTQCYNYLLLPLYANKHWTLAFINKPCAEIWYFNSDLTHGLQYGNVERQMAPYKQHFPTYHIEVVKVPEQTDTYSCGTFVAYFAYCLLFSPASLEKLKGWNAETFRELILKQLVLSYLHD